MKANLVFSSILHLGLFAALLFSRTAPKRFDGYPTVIPVEIVDIKPVSFKAPEVQKVAPKTQKPPPQPKMLEGVTVEKPKIEEEEEEPEERPQKQEEKPKKSDTGKSMVGGEDIKLDVDEFAFSYYLALLKSRIQMNWEPPFGVARPGSILSASVFFRIERNGQLSRVMIAETSGQNLFDQAALRAVTLANPVPPLPYDYHKPSLGVQFRLKHKY